uniref:Uncharacterized protein n=1 Tax=Chromera velia CCMP2878 TaxID=1169474 RepID=A0A0G4FZZ2_9ALVE|eukprot:Cvel_3942.t1-p1 / transcript=Cvel_3942.t1 / gene=Cvel_3942 / organism=Chromera_velia_CCMP2878 / gene_product=hypothetical protein / transcript_product=hypothetical protein / location=Cvel_scaffold167:78349-81171(-) / protein_length=440 / sequence_SO=supercontig / SO=protein_coding / is_pseudo=false
MGARPATRDNQPTPPPRIVLRTTKGWRELISVNGVPLEGSKEQLKKEFISGAGVSVMMQPLIKSLATFLAASVAASADPPHYLIYPWKNQEEEKQDDLMRSAAGRSEAGDGSEGPRQGGEEGGGAGGGESRSSGRGSGNPRWQEGHRSTGSQGPQTSSLRSERAQESAQPDRDAREVAEGRQPEGLAVGSNNSQSRNIHLQEETQETREGDRRETNGGAEEEFLSSDGRWLHELLEAPLRFADPILRNVSMVTHDRWSRFPPLSLQQAVEGDASTSTRVTQHYTDGRAKTLDLDEIREAWEKAPLVEKGRGRCGLYGKRKTSYDTDPQVPLHDIQWCPSILLEEWEYSEEYSRRVAERERRRDTAKAKRECKRCNQDYSNGRHRKAEENPECNVYFCEQVDGQKFQSFEAWYKQWGGPLAAMQKAYKEKVKANNNPHTSF